MQPHTCHEGVPLSQFLAKKFKCRIGKCLLEGDINYYFADHTFPFLYRHFPGNFFLFKNFHISIFWQCVRYSFKSRPFNCDPFSCPGPQRDAPPVLGNELTGNFVVQCTRVGGSASLLSMAMNKTCNSVLLRRV